MIFDSIEHGKNLNKECSSHCNNSIGYCEWCDEGIDKHQAEQNGAVRKGVCCMKGRAEAECDGTIGGNENPRCVAIDTGNYLVIFFEDRFLLSTFLLLLPTL